MKNFLNRLEIYFKKKKEKNSKKILLLWDAENITITHHYEIISNIIISEFGQETWENTLSFTAYQKTEERRINKEIEKKFFVLYVNHGRNNADDKLENILKEEVAKRIDGNITTVISVTNDKELQDRLHYKTNEINPDIDFLVYDTHFLKKYLENKFRDFRETKLNIEALSIAKQLMKVVFYFVNNNLNNANISKNLRINLENNLLYYQLTYRIPQITANNDNDNQKQIHLVLNMLKENDLSLVFLETEGLPVIILKRFLSYAIRGFDADQYHPRISLTDLIGDILEKEGLEIRENKIFLRKENKCKS